MGGYHTLRLYKRAYDERFEQALTKSAAAIGGRLKLNEVSQESDQSLCVGCRDEVTTLLRPGLGGDYKFFERVACELDGCVWIEVRIQDSALWDYSLKQGGQHLDSFSPLPEYWEPDNKLFALSKAGRPQLLAKAWNIEQATIDRYLVQWGYVETNRGFETVVKGKAYPSDRHDYGDYDQFYDFVERLGGVAQPEPRHTIILPERNLHTRTGWRGWISRVLGRIQDF